MDLQYGWEVGQDASGQAALLAEIEIWNFMLNLDARKEIHTWTCLRIEGWAGASGQLF